MIGPESRFSPASVWCPKPANWNSVDNASAELEVTELVGAFVRALQPELVIETGTAFGQTAVAIGSALKSNGHGSLITIEPNESRTRMALLRCCGLPITIIQSTSLEFLDVAPSYRHKGQVGFAWLDSLIELRIPELQTLIMRGWLAPGAIIGIHDTGPKHLLPNVITCERLGLCMLHLRTPRGVTFLQVND